MKALSIIFDLSAIIIIASTFPRTVASAGDCFGYDSCSSCTGQSGCGWDGNMHKCKSGGPMGPSNGGGPRPSKWEWEPSQCGSVHPHHQARDCSRHEHCSNCVMESDASCGWDAVVLKCMLGNASGPAASGVPTADGKEWVFNNADHCPNTYSDCSSHATCKDCTESASGLCGWNSITSLCEKGSVSGPAVGGTLPSSSSWKWTSETCTNPSALCAKHGSCQNCTKELATQCGWNGAKCLEGTFAGPSNATDATNIWAFTAEVCAYMQYSTAACQTDLISCSQRSSCQSCVGAAKEDDLTSDQIGCYWNSVDNKCHNSIDTSSASGVLDYITPGHPDECFSDSAICSNDDDCVSCTAQSSGRCGYDGVLRECMQGNKYGPVRGETKLWSWKASTCPPQPKKCSDLLSCDSCQGDGSGYHSFGEGVWCKWELKNSGWSCVEGSSLNYPTGCSSLEGNCEVGSTGCHSCTDIPGCGWDWNSQKCRSGTLYGPTDGDIPPQWEWTSDQCDASVKCGGQCETATSCSECAGFLNCGWDANNNVCRPGSFQGPAHPTGSHAAPGFNEGYNGVTNVNWNYGYAACSDSSCSFHNGCWDCLKEEGCGWTGDSCVRGNANGPFSHNYVVGGGDGSSMWVQGKSERCPATWSFHWSPKSIAMWLVFGLPLLIFGMCAALWIKGRRKRAQLRAANTPLLGGAAGATTTGGAAAQTAATGAAALAPGPSSAAPVYPYGTASYSATTATTAGGPSPGSPRDPFSGAGAVNPDSVPVMEEIA